MVEAAKLEDIDPETVPQVYAEALKDFAAAPEVRPTHMYPHMLFVTANGRVIPCLRGWQWGRLDWRWEQVDVGCTNATL